jgi:polyferredoxin
MNLQRFIQCVSLGLFLWALVSAPDALFSLWPTDGFLRMDPVVCLATWLADRRLAVLLWVAGLILLLSAVLGRFFCAYVCPMGVAIDISDHLLRNTRRHPTPTTIGALHRWPSKHVKNWMLAFILGGGALGISWVFIASPLTLITRFCGLVLYPVVAFLADMGLHALRPVADAWDLPALAYAVVKVPRYDLQWVTVLTMLAVFVGGVWVPRFWCRCLCPSGALLAIFARRPIARRRVSPDCTQCGICRRVCSMGAIGGSQKPNEIGDAR